MPFYFAYRFTQLCAILYILQCVTCVNFFSLCNGNHLSLYPVLWPAIFLFLFNVWTHYGVAEHCNGHNILNVELFTTCWAATRVFFRWPDYTTKRPQLALGSLTSAPDQHTRRVAPLLSVSSRPLTSTHVGPFFFFFFYTIGSSSRAQKKKKKDNKKARYLLLLLENR